LGSTLQHLIARRHGPHGDADGADNDAGGGGKGGRQYPGAPQAASGDALDRGAWDP